DQQTYPHSSMSASPHRTLVSLAPGSPTPTPSAPVGHTQSIILGLHQHSRLSIITMVGLILLPHPNYPGRLALEAGRPTRVIPKIRRLPYRDITTSTEGGARCLLALTRPCQRPPPPAQERITNLQWGASLHKDPRQSRVLGRGGYRMIDNI